MATPVNSVKRQKIVLLHEVTNPEWRWVSDQMPEVDWILVRAPGATGGLGNRIGRLVAAMRALWDARDADMVISIGAGLGAALELARKLTRIARYHLCYYINFDHLPTGITHARQSRLYRTIDRFVVSSHVEKQLYADHFGIDPARIDVILWGVNPPVASAFQASNDAYVCAVGGNARDYPMLMAVAAARPDIPFVVVARPANLAGLTISANVKILTNIPYGDAMAVVKGARLMALPLVTTDTPCGHVTIVSAFYLGTPLIITGSAGVEDYVIDGETGLVTQSGSATAMGAAIDRLWADTALAQKISTAAKDFAELYCTEKNYPAHIRGLLAGFQSPS